VIIREETLTFQKTWYPRIQPGNGEIIMQQVIINRNNNEYIVFQMIQNGLAIINDSTRSAFREER